MDLAELHGNSGEAGVFDGDEVKLSEKVNCFRPYLTLNLFFENQGQEKVPGAAYTARRAR